MHADQTRHDLWNLAGWLIVSVATIAAAAGYTLALAFWPLATGAGSALAASYFAAWWVPNRGLRAELEAARARLMAFNGSESREALAEVRPSVLYDQDGDQ